MPQKDLFHETVKTALIKDGWKITDDPLPLRFGGRNLFVDLAGEQVIAAEKEEQRIAIEVKSFAGESQVNDLQQATGQYQMYQTVLRRSGELNRKLYLAIPVEAHAGIFSEPLGEAMLLDCRINLIVFEHTEEVIIQWISNP
jgi:predicted RecB family endonuclease